jgi:hypothetical protein
MQAHESSENVGLSSKPIAVKNRLDASRSLTGRFTKIIRIRVTPREMALPFERVAPTDLAPRRISSPGDR